jgi:uncharacterized YigZ family protein
VARYPVPGETQRVEIRSSNSRFIATIARASTVKEARAFLQSIRDEMPDATHHVYAYRVGYGASVTDGMSDDGEPGGTSGPPALAVLRGTDIGDVVLVITRYFGGTKLGTGGLVAAYSAAAKAAVEALDIVEKIDRVPVRMSVPYAAQKSIRQAIERYEGVIEQESFEADVTYGLRIPVERLEAFRKEVANLSDGKVAIEPEPTDNPPPSA